MPSRNSGPSISPISAGPRRPLPHPGAVSILGPGTGLGVALTLLDADGHRVVETEGGHFGFAPRDPFEDALLARLREKYGRVSVERVVSGPGLADIRAALPGAGGRARAQPTTRLSGRAPFPATISCRAPPLSVSVPASAPSPATSP